MSHFMTQDYGKISRVTHSEIPLLDTFMCKRYAMLLSLSFSLLPAFQGESETS